MGYRSNEELAEDNHSSALVLIPVGIIGLIADAFVITTNPLHMPIFNKYLSTGVMGAMFVLFIVMGIFSVRSYRRFSYKAREENTLAGQIHEWCSENLTADVIDREITGTPGSEEMYFLRTAYIKDRITHKFMNLDEDMVERFVENYYSEIFDA